MNFNGSNTSPFRGVAKIKATGLGNFNDVMIVANARRKVCKFVNTFVQIGE